jgi:hypothetical protein
LIAKHRRDKNLALILNVMPYYFNTRASDTSCDKTVKPKCFVEPKLLDEIPSMKMPNIKYCFLFDASYYLVY